MALGNNYLEIMFHDRDALGNSEEFKAAQDNISMLKNEGKLKEIKEKDSYAGMKAFCNLKTQ